MISRKDNRKPKTPVVPVNFNKSRSNRAAIGEVDYSEGDFECANRFKDLIVDDEPDFNDMIK